ncbi:hypothetical protein KPL71_008951 [Citrus sinensis]|uniref:Uncharacterized protein n=1 Tax=Citrus sinensis TaxID=2711 RepID=A0ACB8MAC1_CITSI|nr:hypothetical protein KPL71_008951 [Citrus sinensis]
MDTDELIRKCNAITISEEDKTSMSLEVNIKATRGKMLASCLVGKVLLTRAVNKEGFKSALQQVWRTVKEVKIESLGNNCLMFKFTEEADKKRVLTGGPWHFDRALLVLTEPKGIGELTKQSFTHTAFWIQIHNVPIACMEKELIQELGGMIGAVEEIETDENGECLGEFARIRVLINITLPLKKILFLKQEGESDIQMPVVYERLPDFCYCCGIIGHQYKECAKFQGQQKEQLPYGGWMKAIIIGEHNGIHRQRQQQQKSQDNPVRTSGSEPMGEKTDQTGETTKIDEVEGVGEQNLMRGVVESMQEKQMGGKKHGGNISNEIFRREEGILAGDGMEKERENFKTNLQEMEEAKIGNGLEITQSRPTKRKWKRRAREPNGRESKMGLGAHKRTSREAMGQSPKKKAKLSSPIKSETKKQGHHCPAAKIKLSWEPLMLENMEDMDSTIAEISAEAGSQPRRQP